MRKQLEDGRFSDPNGTVEEKYLHYFYAHQKSERVGREHIADNDRLIGENQELRERLARAEVPVAKG